MQTRVKKCPQCSKVNPEWMQFCKECYAGLADVPCTFEESGDLPERPPVKHGLNENQEERKRESERILKEVAYLAHAGTDQAVEAIIRVANGIKAVERGTWKTLWTDTPTDFYTLEEQLAAIDALAETGSKKALKFLERIRQGQTQEATTDRKVANDGYTKLSSRTFVQTHPNANGPLRAALRMEVRENIYGYGDWDFQSMPIITRLDAAISKLRSGG